MGDAPNTSRHAKYLSLSKPGTGICKNRKYVASVRRTKKLNSFNVETCKTKVFGNSPSYCSILFFFIDEI